MARFNSLANEVKLNENFLIILRGNFSKKIDATIKKNNFFDVEFSIASFKRSDDDNFNSTSFIVKNFDFQDMNVVAENLFN
jgi:hypothetical protein